jgi:hypothetical protein
MPAVNGPACVGASHADREACRRAAARLAVHGGHILQYSASEQESVFRTIMK